MTRYRDDEDPAPANVTYAPDSPAPAAPAYDEDGNVIEAVKPLPAPVVRETQEQEDARLETQRRLQAAREQATLPSFVPAQSAESKEAEEKQVAAQREQRAQAKRDQDEQAAKQRDAEAGVRATNDKAAEVPPAWDTVSAQSNPDADDRADRTDRTDRADTRSAREARRDAKAQADREAEAAAAAERARNK